MNTDIFIKINSWAGQYAWLDKLMVFSAEWLGYVMLAVLVFLYFKDKKKFKDMVFLALSAAIAARFLIVVFIRFFYYSPRPFLVLENINQLVGHETTSSFPSGHASFYFALAMGVYLHNKKAGLVYFVLAGLMSFARIFVGVHWPLDILAGAIVGVVAGLILNRTWIRNSGL